MFYRKYKRPFHISAKAVKRGVSCAVLLGAAAGLLSLYPIGGAEAAMDARVSLPAAEPSVQVFTSFVPASAQSEEEDVVITKQYSDIHYEEVQDPCPVRYVDSPYLAKGQEMVLEQGNGNVYSVEYAALSDGTKVELERTLLFEAREKLVLRGTGAKALSAYATTDFTPLSFDESTGIMEVQVGDEILKIYGAIKVTSTAYCPCRACCGAYARGITSTGTKAKVGTVAVDPKVIPYGTKLYVTSSNGTVYGRSAAEDCGGAIKGARVDLFFNSHAEAIQYGRQSSIVYILAE